jgi:hypothetical protein
MCVSNQSDSPIRWLLNDSGAYKGSSDAKPTTLSFIGVKEKARWNAVHVAAKYDRPNIIEAVLNELAAFVGDVQTTRIAELVVLLDRDRQDKEREVRSDCEVLLRLYVDAYLNSPVCRLNPSNFAMICLRTTAITWKPRCILHASLVRSMRCGSWSRWVRLFVMPC